MAQRLGAGTDLHSHLVPGVDDGSRTVGESLEAVGKFVAAGVGHIVTTPHLEGSLTHDPGALAGRLEEMDEAWDLLLENARTWYPEVRLYRGHEVMLDVPDPDLSDLRVHLHDTPFVLVEWPGLRVPPATLRVLSRLESEGVRPVLAHPERYRGLDGELDLSREWRRVGALLQVNYGSFVGRYGEAARERAVALLERGWIDLLSSDYHGRPHLSPLLREAREEFAKLGGDEHFEILSTVNTGRVLKGEDPIPVPSLATKRRVLERVRSLFRPDRRR